MQTPNLPAIKDEPVQRPKPTIFPFLIWGEGGGLNFTLLIFVQDCNHGHNKMEQQKP